LTVCGEKRSFSPTCRLVIPSTISPITSCCSAEGLDQVALQSS
jgi:hypothetical protein